MFFRHKSTFSYGLYSRQIRNVNWEEKYFVEANLGTFARALQPPSFGEYLSLKIRLIFFSVPSVTGDFPQYPYHGIRQPVENFRIFTQIVCFDIKDVKTRPIFVSKLVICRCFHYFSIYVVKRNMGASSGKNLPICLLNCCFVL